MQPTSHYLAQMAEQLSIIADREGHQMAAHLFRMAKFELQGQARGDLDVCWCENRAPERKAC